VTGGTHDSVTSAETGRQSVEDRQVEAGHLVGEGHLDEAGHQVAIDLHFAADRHFVVVEGMARFLSSPLLFASSAASDFYSRVFIQK